jgi:hypothetical protein
VRYQKPERNFRNHSGTLDADRKQRSVRFINSVFAPNFLSMSFAASITFGPGLNSTLLTKDSSTVLTNSGSLVDFSTALERMLTIF